MTDQMLRLKFFLRMAFSLQNNKSQLFIYLFVTRVRLESCYYYTKHNACQYRILKLLICDIST